MWSRSSTSARTPKTATETATEARRGPGLVNAQPDADRCQLGECEPVGWELVVAGGATRHCRACPRTGRRGDRNEASFERTTTDPSFADFLDRRSSVLGRHRNLSLVRRPLVATRTGPTLKNQVSASLPGFPFGIFQICRRPQR